MMSCLPVVLCRSGAAAAGAPRGRPRRAACSTLPAKDELPGEGQRSAKDVYPAKGEHPAKGENPDKGGHPAKVKEICPRGNNKVVIYISLYHDKCLLFMLELY